MSNWFSNLRQAAVKVGMVITFAASVIISPLSAAKEWLLEDTTRQQKPQKVSSHVPTVTPITFPKSGGSSSSQAMSAAHSFKPLLSKHVHTLTPVNSNKLATQPLVSEAGADNELAKHFARINAEIEHSVQASVAKPAYARQRLYQPCQQAIKPTRRMVYPVSQIEPPKSSRFANILGML